jgi:hypothetical protein
MKQTAAREKDDSNIPADLFIREFPQKAGPRSFASIQ